MATGEKLMLYTDGGSRGNPGPAAYGYVLKDESGAVVAKEGKYIGTATNNMAEYQAIIAGLRKAKSLKPSSVQCFMDSELAVKQLNGEYKLKDKNIQKYFIVLWNLRVEIGTVTFQHVPREENTEADAMVNAALDAQAQSPSLPGM